MCVTFKNYCSGSGAARLAHTLGVREVAGSNPASPTMNSFVSANYSINIFNKRFSI